MDLIVALIVGFGGVIVGVLGWQWWLQYKNLKPSLDTYEKYLEPFVFQAIISAYKLSEYAIDETGQRIKGADKKEIAIRIYNMLPDEIAGVDIVSIKTKIGPDRFVWLIQEVFDKTMVLMEENKSAFDQAYKQWLTENSHD